MDRSNRHHAARLTEAQQARLEELRETCARLDSKGRVGTVHHEELARLEALVADMPEPSTHTFKPQDLAAHPSEED